MKKVAIIGGGSVGLLLGSYLSEADTEVTIYAKTIEQAYDISRKGILLKKNDSMMNYQVNGLPMSSEIVFQEEIIFIAVKQYQTEKVIAQLSGTNLKNKSLVFIQNGMSHLDQLEKLSNIVGNIFVGIVEHGALRKSNCEVEHTGIGEMKVGQFSGVNKETVVWERLSNAGFFTTVSNDWYEIMLNKLFVNAIINPLTAIFQVKNGGLLHNQYAYQVMQELFRELTDVFQCTEENWKQIVQVCKQTSLNKSSMFRDIENKRETEIDAITGFVLKIAKQKNINVPYNEFVYNCIKGMELQRKEP